MTPEQLAEAMEAEAALWEQYGNASEREDQIISATTAAMVLHRIAARIRALG